MKWIKVFLIPLLLVATIIFSSCVVSADYTFYDDTSFSFNTNINLTFSSNGVTVDSFRHESGWMQFNTLGFNITSSNDIDIVLYSLNSNITAAAPNDIIVRFTANTSGGTVYFNISGLDDNVSYNVYRDDVLDTRLVANYSGGISFTGTSWSEHDYVIREGSQYIRVIYDHGEMNTLQPFFLITIVLTGVLSVVIVAAFIINNVKKGFGKGGDFN